MTWHAGKFIGQFKERIRIFECFGMKVEVIYTDKAATAYNVHKRTYRNVTKIYYGYQSGRMVIQKGADSLLEAIIHGGMMIAFDSDIHGSGATSNMNDIKEFIVKVETEVAKRFTAE